MNIEELREFCLGLPAVTEDIKWENHLVFSVAGKIFCLTGLEPPLEVALKIPEDQFDDLTTTAEIIQASHFARRQWITVLEESRLSREEWEHYIRQSYNLVKSKLPKKVQAGISADETSKAPSYSAVIPAAGNSERMGRDKTTLALQHGLSIARHLVNCFGAYGCRPVVMVVNEKTDVSSFRVENLVIEINRHVSMGRTWSIQLGLQHVPEGSCCFIQNVDNPFLDPGLLDSLLKSVTPGGYAVPVYNGQGGHPVLLGNKVVDAFRVARECLDFRLVLERFKRIEVPCSSEEVLLNLNTPRDYMAFIHRVRF